MTADALGYRERWAFRCIFRQAQVTISDLWHQYRCQQADNGLQDHHDGDWPPGVGHIAEDTG